MPAEGTLVAADRLVAAVVVDTPAVVVDTPAVVVVNIQVEPPGAAEAAGTRVALPGAAEAADKPAVQ